MLSTVVTASVVSSPNFFFLFTDDQDIELGSMQAVETVEKIVVKGGATMKNFFTHTPVCCPSRSETLTGRYFHNIRMNDYSTPGCMHVNASKEMESETVAAYLSKAGYHTGMFGKYLNMGGMDAYCPKEGGTAEIPDGWDRFLGMCPDTCYLDCVFNDQGKWSKFDDPSNPKGSNYATSVMANATYDWLVSIENSSKPFFAYLAPHAPHGPAIPAPWYTNARWGNDTIVPRLPTWNMSAPDHNWMVAVEPALTQSYSDSMDEFYRNRLRTLLTVDDSFRLIHDLLVKQGKADNTYFIYSSDHGFHMGNFRLGAKKRTMYRTDIRIPFGISGPGIVGGTELDYLTGLTDLTPTILELAGVDIPSNMDGKSIAGMVHGVKPAQWRDAFLVEYYATSIDKPNIDSAGHVVDVANNTFIALHIDSTDPKFTMLGNGHLTYAEYTDVHDWDFQKSNWGELYDMEKDPWQTTNLFYTADKTLLQNLHERLRKEWACKGETCS
eukprot:TRINITY_DN4747_c1_g1_i1.p1 TRINITY_DN4747_c1_g1~~TRINITY_DN4747_c1_g1_i1.p1  ORF type:complete len:496 (+),score=76.31 TRINITY_DN4747_c1_g1_i1:39-1526(+)